MTLHDFPGSGILRILAVALATFTKVIVTLGLKGTATFATFAKLTWWHESLRLESAEA